MKHIQSIIVALAISLVILLSAGLAAPCFAVTPSASVTDSVIRSEKEVSLFKVNRTNLQNNDALQRLVEIAEEAYTQSNLDSIVIEGSASPDGPYSNNIRLSRKRAAMVKDYFQKNSNLPEPVFIVRALGENILLFRKIVSELDDSVARDQIFALLDSGMAPDVWEKKLRKMNGGKIWYQLLKNQLPRLRNTITTLHLRLPDSEVIADFGLSDQLPPLPAIAPVPSFPAIGPLASVEIPVLPVKQEWHRYAYIKTNLPAWAFLWVNIAAEVDLEPHWSIEFPVYYSGWDYFKNTLKARIFSVQPEGRFWLNSNNRGFFVGAHVGVAWYNFAFDGPTRYQDHRGRTPALGGGVSIGWRFRDLGYKNRWNFEATVGLGTYRLDYDYFRNFHNGPLYDRRKRTFYGVDRAAVSISYRFDITRKKNRQ